ncbi:Glutathione S-transferase 1, isoform D [Papilio machaon]|uniref:Glutathione S-transferase 1, isoform D n=1 Tax=Papilio machaon TaxID=76193 RepID=A0A194R9T0_PAPMA|nr:Glutathione S-transferase 1, isoform D [Papilio machaon]
MAIDLYYTPGSAPCRAVLLVLAALNIDFNHNLVDLRAGEQLKPEFLKLNPQHTVPTIADDGFSLWESRAIGRYLVNQYGGDSELYPKDPKARAVVDQRLDFDLGSLYPKFAQYFYPQVFFGGQPANEEHLKQLKGSLDFLNTFLEGSKYAAGEELTLADLSLVATVSTIDTAGISIADYPNVLNPQHTVPTIADDGFSLWESRAIGRYLVNQYGGDSELYPKDPKARAVVDQRLDFDLGSLYPKFAQYFYPQVFRGQPANEEHLKQLKGSLDFLNTFLEGSKYAAGEELTLADLSLVATVSTIDTAGISIADYPNVVR